MFRIIPILLAFPLVANGLVISEFLAINRSGIEDESGLRQDWIELLNDSEASINLEGYFLTDDPNQLNKWALPAYQLEPLQRLLIFASGENQQEEPAFHTNFRLDGRGEFLALVLPDGQTTLQAFDPAFPEQFPDVSYGITVEGEADYLQKATPGGTNGEGVLGFLEKPSVSVNSGSFEQSFKLRLGHTSPDVVIRFTRDGSEPDHESGEIYTTPLLISQTQVIRAVATRVGYVSSDLASHAYLFPNKLLENSGIDQGFFASPEAPTWRQALGALPWLSIAADPDALFGDEGIYENPLDKGRNAEIPVALSWLNDQETSFSTTAGLRIHGGAARLHPKRPLRLHFRADYGDRWLDVPLFSGSHASRFRSVVLRGQGQDAWSEPTSAVENSFAFHATYLRDTFVREREHSIGLATPHSRFTHVFLNGRYWGIYDLQEHPSAEYFSEKFGGDVSEWDVVRSGGPVVQAIPRADLADGNLEAWNDLQTLSAEGLNTAPGYEAVQEWLDLESYIDSLISRMWAGDHDWLGPATFMNFETPTQSRNWFAGRHSRGQEPGPFHCFTWDAEIALGSNLFFFLIAPKRTLNLDLTSINHLDSPAFPFSKLREHSAFQQLFGDRVHQHLSHALSTDQTQPHWNDLVAQLRTPLFAEAARWIAIHGENSGLGVAETWDPEVAWIRDEFLTKRSKIFLEQCRKAGLFPDIDPPAIEFEMASGQMTISPPTEALGEIFFTINGGDPAEPGSERYVSPLLLANPARVRARFRSETQDWSALAEITIDPAAVPASTANLVVSEFLPFPEGNGPHEFVEVFNCGDQPVQLRDAQWTHGIRFTFPDQVLMPETFAIVAQDINAFRQHYPNHQGILLGPYDGRLANDGERLRLEAANGTTLFHFNFDTQLWPSLEGQSLERRNTAREGNAESWRLSLKPGGTPGAPSGGTPYDPQSVQSLHEYAASQLTIESVNQALGDQSVVYPTLRLESRAGADDLKWQWESSEDLVQWSPLSLRLTSHRIEEPIQIYRYQLPVPLGDHVDITMRYYRAKFSVPSR